MKHLTEHKKVTDAIYWMTYLNSGSSEFEKGSLWWTRSLLPTPIVEIWNQYGPHLVEAVELFLSWCKCNFMSLDELSDILNQLPTEDTSSNQSFWIEKIILFLIPILKNRWTYPIFVSIWVNFKFFYDIVNQDSFRNAVLLIFNFKASRKY